MQFYLGTHKMIWLERTTAPLFVSRRWLAVRKSLPVAAGRWALDSGGFTELSMYGEWQTSAEQYVTEVRQFRDEIGGLDWVAPQDWMCEPIILAQTGLTVEEHQLRTVDNFLRLRDELGRLVIPVLQGWVRDDYLRCVERYEAAGVELEDEAVVGLGTICRRQDTVEAAKIVRELETLRLHAFGAKITGLRVFGDSLVSADSLAWSYNARREPPLPGCKHRRCNNCLRYALRWREHLITTVLSQQRLEFA